MLNMVYIYALQNTSQVLEMMWKPTLHVFTIKAAPLPMHTYI